MKLSNKILSLFLLVVLILSMLPLTVSAATYSGVCGDDVTWVLDADTGVLTISGQGEMTDYMIPGHDGYSNQPWREYNGKIKRVAVENGVTSIGNSAFYGCAKLTEIAIPNSVKTIGYSFSLFSTLINYNGTSMEWVTLRNNNSKSELNMYVVNCLDKTLYPFGSCGENVEWEMDMSTKCMTISGTGPMKDYNSYLGFTGVWDYFIDDIYTVIINEGVESIGKYAFSYCPNLMSVSIPKSVTKIGADAFFVCEKLNDVVLPEGVVEIGSSAFAGCYMLKTITIPASVTTIGAGAFAAPESIFVAKGNQYYSSDKTGVLFDKDKSVLIQYPSSSPEEYYEIPKNVKIISAGAFLNSKNLKDISISENVDSIGESAFKNCAKLESIKIPDGIKAIPESAFAYCSSLKRVYIPNSVSVIENYAFEYCSKLENVKIPYGVKTIGQYAFGSCGNLKAIVIPDSVTLIDMYAFYSSGVRDVVLGKGLTEITEGAFGSCSSLREISIPENVIKIGVNAFSGTRLLEVWIPTSVVQIGWGAFNLFSTEKLENIYYMGTKQQWEKIKITDRYGYDYSKAKIHYSCQTTEAAPTCTERGTITHICDCCNATIFGGYIAPKGHNYISINETLPTCTKHGVTNYNCEVCESSYWEYSANPTGHTLNEDGVCETCGEKEVSASHVNTQMLSVESVLAMVMSLLAKLFGIFTVA